jgi:transposase-like protein
MGVRAPHDVAEQLIAEAPDRNWLRVLTDDLDRQLRTDPLERLLALWGISASDAARAFGVTRQALSKWRQSGVPADRTPALMDLSAATDLLDRRVKRERIPAVVRRPAARLGGRSLLDLACDGRHAEVRDAVAAMFDLRRVQP